MPQAETARILDPLAAFMAHRTGAASEYPVPLVSTSFDVLFEAGLAVVTTRRVFRNAENRSIEATLTFPVPIHAVLFDLVAEIEGRRLRATATPKSAARESYEHAVDRGKGAVLHEEILKGIHMLSVAHLPPGEEIAVTTSWAITLTMVQGEGHLRIPLTVGDVYGRSPLADSDDLLSGGKPQMGKLKVVSPDSAVRLVGGLLGDNPVEVPLNKPIDLVVERWRPRILHGRTDSGARVSLTLTPAPTPARNAPLDIAILVDHSGSMGEPCHSGAYPASKHEMVSMALQHLAESLGPTDVVDLWEFDDTARRMGVARAAPGEDLWPWSNAAASRLKALVRRLSGPAGGTEIGGALKTVLQQSRARNILVITDGKSHALDIQALARAGRRVSVVLVGEDSLEANVGHLAALTGGDIFVGGGADLSELLEAAVSQLRQRDAGIESGQSAERQVSRGGLVASWTWESGKSQQGEAEPAQLLLPRAVASVVAGFQLPLLSEAEATKLAQEVGIVSHLTSLVMVDEAAIMQEGMPEQRKITLPAPATRMLMKGSMAMRHRTDSNLALGFIDRNFARLIAVFGEPKTPPVKAEKLFKYEKGPLPPPNALETLAMRIDWGLEPSKLVAGDIVDLDEDARMAVINLAADAEIIDAANYFGVSPIGLTIGLLATLAAKRGNRAARRIANGLRAKIGRIRYLQLIELLSKRMEDRASYIERTKDESQS